MAEILMGSKVIRKSDARRGFFKNPGTVERVYPSWRNGQMKARVHWQHSTFIRLGTGHSDNHSDIALSALVLADEAPALREKAVERAKKMTPALQRTLQAIIERTGGHRSFQMAEVFGAHNNEDNTHRRNYRRLMDAGVIIKDPVWQAGGTRNMLAEAYRPALKAAQDGPAQAEVQESRDMQWSCDQCGQPTKDGWCEACQYESLPF